MNCRQYEALIITAPGVEVSQGSAMKSTFEQLCEKAGGRVAARHELGKRTLGYEVGKGVREGNVASYDFELSPDKAQEFRRSLELAEDILKFLITVKAKAKK